MNPDGHIIGDQALDQVGLIAFEPESLHALQTNSTLSNQLKIHAKKKWVLFGRAFQTSKSDRLDAYFRTWCNILDVYNTGRFTEHYQRGMSTFPYK